jgi:hypothetical protein
VTLLSQEGWSLVETDSITSELQSDDVRVVVFFEPTLEIIDLATSNPGIQFVALGTEGLEPQANLSIIGPDGFRLDQQAFLGGYLAAVLTQDWRIGEIVEGSDEIHSTIEVSFRNGVKFYCGLCQISYPPFNDYPIHTTVDSATREGDWISSIDFLESNAVETVFLFIQNFEVQAVGELVDNEVLLIGIKPPPETIRSNWIATIRLAPEQVLYQKWRQIISNEGGWVEAIPIVLEDVNQSLFSEGKQRFIEKILLDIQSGYIDTAVTPPAPIGN